jgi:hypothetical protein
VPDDQITIVGKLQPGGDTAVMVRRGDEDLIAWPEAAAHGAGEREVQRGHVRTEDHFVRLAAEEPGRLVLGLRQDLAHPAARRIARAEVGARLTQRPGDGFTDLVGHLGAAWGVEEREVPQGGEALPHRGDVEARTECFGHRQVPLRDGTGERVDFDRITTAGRTSKPFPCPGAQRNGLINSTLDR